MRVLLFRGMCRTKEIEAKVCAANDDILRCRPLVLISLRQAATKRAENSVTIGMDSRGSNRDSRGSNVAAWLRIRSRSAWIRAVPTAPLGRLRVRSVPEV